MPKYLKNESGATAVEYGLIAGLIALGIVGSLVSTRASLNGAFGAISSGLPGAASTAAPVGGQLSTFQSKTLSNFKKTVSGGVTTYAWTYSDGSTASYYVEPTSTRPFRVEMVDNANSFRRIYYTDSNGVMNTVGLYNLYTNGVIKDYQVSLIADISNGVINNVKTATYQSNGTNTSTGNKSPDSAYLTMASQNADNFNFYKNLASQN